VKKIDDGVRRSRLWAGISLKRKCRAKARRYEKWSNAIFSQLLRLCRRIVTLTSRRSDANFEVDARRQNRCDEHPSESACRFDLQDWFPLKCELYLLQQLRMADPDGEIPDGR
jgi:hypothetical protein